jgi:hypothetical protein
MVFIPNHKIKDFIAVGARKSDAYIGVVLISRGCLYQGVLISGVNCKTIKKVCKQKFSFKNAKKQK